MGTPIAEKSPIPDAASIESTKNTVAQATNPIKAAFSHPPGYLAFIIHIHAKSTKIGPRIGIKPKKNPVMDQIKAPIKAVITA